MLDERKLKLVELILKGENKSNAAKIIGISRQTVYEWLNDHEVIEELGNRRDELIQSGKEKLANRLDTYLDVLHNLATASTDKRTQASCAMYLTDRILGKVSAIKEEQPSDKKEDQWTGDMLDEIFREVDEKEEKEKQEKLKLIK